MELSTVIDGNLENLDVKELEAFRSNVAADSVTVRRLQHIEKSRLKSFMHSVFNAVLKNVHLELSKEEKDRRKLLLHCLTNAASRAARIRSCADKHSEACIRAMSELGWLLNETCACIVDFSRPENGSMYYHTARNLCTAWNRNRDELKKLDGNGDPDLAAEGDSARQTHEANVYKTRLWLLAVFANYLEYNERFLAVCNEMFGESLSDTFVDIIDKMIEMNGETEKIQFAAENVRYILTLLKNALNKFGKFEEVNETEEEEEEVSNEDIKKNVLRTIILVEIILHFEKKEKYRGIFNAETTAARLILYVIEGILHYDYCQYQNAAGERNSGDRPQINLSPRNAANVSCVRNFAKALRTYDAGMIEKTKILCLEMIGFLSRDNDSIRAFFGENDGISLLLRCMYVRDGHNPYMKHHAILALKFLVHGYAPNQQRLAELDQEPSAIIDRDKLLENLGLRAVYEPETRKIRLEQRPD